MMKPTEKGDWVANANIRQLSFWGFQGPKTDVGTGKLHEKRPHGGCVLFLDQKNTYVDVRIGARLRLQPLISLIESFLKDHKIVGQLVDYLATTVAMVSF